MLEVEKNTVQKQVKDIENLELFLAHIPTNALYRLQVSMMREV